MAKSRVFSAGSPNDRNIRDNRDLTLAELSLDRLFQLNKENMQELYALIGSTKTCSFSDNQYGLYSKINLRFPIAIEQPNLKFALLNTIFTFNSLQNIETIIKKYRADHLPFTCWVNTEDPFVEDLTIRLTHNNMQVETLLNCIAIECAVGNLTLQLPEGVRIVQVSQAEQLQDWIMPIQIMYKMDHWEADIFIKIYTELLSSAPQIKHYIAYYEDKPIAASTLFLGKSTAGLYNRASTIPPIEGKNIACGLMISTELKFAYQQGYRLTVSQTQPRIAKIMTRTMGFMTCGQYKLFMGWK